MRWPGCGSADGSRDRLRPSVAMCTLFIGELALIAVSSVESPPPLAALTMAHVVNLALILWLAWQRQWSWVGSAAVVPAWLATVAWRGFHPEPERVAGGTDSVGVTLRGVRVVSVCARPPRARVARSVSDGHRGQRLLPLRRAKRLPSGRPVHASSASSRSSRVSSWRCCCERCSASSRRAAAIWRDSRSSPATALGFATVAIPLQLRQQWITIGWALEGAALAWLYRRIPHRGLLYSAVALLSVVFVRLALNPAVFVYEPRGMRVLNWYLYAYLTCGVAMFVAAWWFSRTDDDLLASADWSLRASTLLPPAGVILLFLLLNIEIADFYATGPEITFRFGVTIAQDLDLHRRLADLRARPAGRRHLPAQSTGTHDRRRADRGHDVQGVSLRHGIPRRSVSGGVARRSCHLALARGAGAAEVRAASAEGRLMIKAAIRFVPAILVIALATVAAQQTPAPTQFRFERPVRTGGSGPRRLAIDVTLLTGSRPFQGTASLGGGLSDLRFFDTAGQEMAYLLVPNPPAEPVWKRGRDAADRTGGNADREEQRLRSRPW